jgi:hypothetical protein
MDRCKYETCSNEITGSSAYCSNSCRAKESKRNRTGATIEAQPSGATSAFITGLGTVYNRQAVIYKGDQWPSRPTPLNSYDQPHVGGRSKYTRQDGSVYQFDCNGSAFEVTKGKVYKTINEVKACYV